jgi:hypothetical protein
VLAVAAAVLLAVLLWPGGGGAQGVVDKARAALGNGPILHLVYLQPSGMQFVELQGTRTIVPPYETEIWTDRKLEYRHMIVRLNGQAISESVAPDDLKRAKASFGTIDPAYAALWTGYRKALDHGTAKVERQGRLFGRHVYWLRFPPAGPASTGSLVAVDRRTYRPLAFRYGHRFQARVLLARLRAYAAADFRHRTNLNSLAGVSSSSGSSSSPAASRRPAKPWLTAGPTVAGLRQTSVGTISESNGGRIARGFAVDYGPESGSALVRIEQLKRPPDRSDWRGIPRGFVGVIEGERPGLGYPTKPLWVGNLVVDGVYVTIQAGSRRTLLAAAGALRPV